jgi:hypothetical protein
MYGRADGMPSFQLTMAVRENSIDFTEYIDRIHAVVSPKTSDHKS